MYAHAILASAEEEGEGLRTIWNGTEQADQRSSGVSPGEKGRRRGGGELGDCIGGSPKRGGGHIGSRLEKYKGRQPKGRPQRKGSKVKESPLYFIGSNKEGSICSHQHAIDNISQTATEDGEKTKRDSKRSTILGDTDLP